MKKKKVTQSIGKSIYFDLWSKTIEDNPSINTIIQSLEIAKKDGATNVKFIPTLDIDDHSLEDLQIQPVKVREETDSEFNKRKDLIKKRNERKDLENRRRYEELKAIYEPDK